MSQTLKGKFFICALQVSAHASKGTIRDKHPGEVSRLYRVKLVASAHHGGYMWMISPAAGISWAAVSRLNNTSTWALSSETGSLWWWPTPGGRWCAQRTSCMLQSSLTSSTSSTSTPGLSTGEQSNNNTDVQCVPVKVRASPCSQSLALCGAHYALWE